jgi:hypothetical protein
VRIFAGEVAEFFCGVFSGERLPTEGAGVFLRALQLLGGRGTGRRNQGDARFLFQEGRNDVKLDS